MRALIRVFGSPAIGMGHVMRSLELAQELQKKGVVVLGFLCNDDCHSTEKIRGRGFRCISGHWPDDGKVAENLLHTIALEKAEILILDYPGDLLGLCSILKMSLPRLFIVALDSFALENEHLDMIVNLINHNQMLKAPVSKRVRYYEGVQYAIIRTSFDTYIDREKIIRPQAKSILVSFGGSDPKEHTLRVMKAVKSNFPMEATFHFVLGINFAHQKAIKQMVPHLGVKGCFHEDVDFIEELMHHCDMGLVGAGTTMMEMACLGTPAIVLAQSENEARFADYFDQCGAVRNLRLADELPVENVREAIIELAGDQVARREMSRVGKRLVDGQGKERIAELIVRNYSLFREKHA